MKRTFSINISGIIFNIEEDCYDHLKKYLQSIYQYFATFEDSQEIIEDINSRIAEIFYEKTSKHKQVITAEDVEELIATMGSVEDFQQSENDPAYQMTFEEKSGMEIPTEDDFKGASTVVKVKEAKPIYIPTEKVKEKEKLEEELIYASATPQYQDFKEKFYSEAETNTYKRLFRDTKRSVLGGVAAGLAHYLGVEPLWIRLAFLTLLTGLFFIPAAPQVAVLTYIVMWIFVPKNDHLEENPRIRKLYRNPERGVIGGVCSGLAMFLGLNEMAIRIAFLLSAVAFGSGIFMYLILWMIVPAAKTLAEKMEMEGQSFNLRNIVASIKDEDDEPNLSAAHKVLVFPFQIFSMFFKQIAYMLRPLVGFTAEAIRIFGGLILIIISMLLTLSVSIAVMAFLGIGIDERMIQLGDSNVPFQLIKNSFSVSTLSILSFGVSALVPFIFLGLFGVMMLRRQIIWNNRFGWSMIGLWFLSLISTGLGVASLMHQVRETGEYQEVMNFSNKNKMLLLTLNRPQPKQYRLAQLQLVGYEGKDLKLEKNYIALGADEDEASLNAQMIDYQVAQKDSTLIFDRGAIFKPKTSKYRNQRLNMILHIPYNQVFMMNEDIERILQNTLYPHGYSARDIKGNKWQFTPEGLLCLTCQKEAREEDDDDSEKLSAIMEVEDFNQLEIRGAFEVEIKKGDKFQLKIADEELRKNVNIEQGNNVLEISSKRGGFKNRGRLQITIPEMESFDLSLQGAAKVKIRDFKTQKLSVEINGASQLDLQGQAKTLEADINGAGELKAFEMPFEVVNLEIAGAASAQLYVKNSLYVEAAGACAVSYKGNPKSVKKEVSGLSSIKKID